MKLVLVMYYTNKHGVRRVAGYYRQGRFSTPVYDNVSGQIARRLLREVAAHGGVPVIDKDLATDRGRFRSIVRRALAEEPYIIKDIAEWERHRPRGIADPYADCT